MPVHRNPRTKTWQHGGALWVPTGVCRSCTTVGSATVYLTHTQPQQRCGARELWAHDAIHMAARAMKVSRVWPCRRQVCSLVSCAHLIISCISGGIYSTQPFSSYSFQCQLIAIGFIISKLTEHRNYFMEGGVLQALVRFRNTVSSVIHFSTTLLLRIYGIYLQSK